MTSTRKCAERSAHAAVHRWLCWRLRMVSMACMPSRQLMRTGAGWYEANSNQMLALRCAKYNGTLDQVFVRYKQRLWERSECPNATVAIHDRVPERAPQCLLA